MDKQETRKNRIERKSAKKAPSDPFRKCIQAGWAILSNSYINGFLPGPPAIYSGPLKQFCVPGMNCYSCPGALGSCPIGSLQALFAARQRSFGAYVIGYLAVIGLFVGRFVCGWLCPFGLIQELLYKIPSPKITVPEKPDRVLRYLKYLVLIVLVFALPFFYRSQHGAGEPFFCKYVCPVGTLEGGIPLVLLDPLLRGALGWLFRWKFLLLLLCVASSIFIYRPFCKYICPLGAFYGLFQKLSLIRLRVDEHKCVDCGLCAATCKMDVDPHKTPNSSECIRCRACVKVCPMHALSMGIGESSPEPEELVH